MRFLHTSDWHVGKTIRERDRTEEFSQVLDEVVALAVDQKVDAVLVSGDLFEHKAPRPDAEELVYRTLARLHGNGVRVVAIAGNHDSALRWSAIRSILEPLGVSVVTHPAPPEDGTLIEVRSKDGTDAALVACVPFVAERYFGSAARAFAGSENWPQDYAEGMGDLLAAMAAAFRPDRVNILLAHLFASGAELGGGEMPMAISIDYMVPPARFPGTASYIGLGHIHRPQQVKASPAPAYYAGSLLQLDFGERAQKKSVRVIDAKPGKPATVSEVLLHSGRPLVDLVGTLAELQVKAATVGDAFLRVRVTTDGPVPGIADQIRELLPNAVDIRADYERDIDQEPSKPSLIGLAPREQYGFFYNAKYGKAPTAEVLATFDELLDSVQTERQ